MQKSLDINNVTKKQLFYIVAILLVCAFTLIGFLVSFLFATENEEFTNLSYFEFFLQENDTYSIRAKNIESIPTSVTLPFEYEGKPVTIIEDFGFNGCKNLERIVIPNGVTTIGESAFMGCSSLVSIAIPNTLEFVGNYAFLHCGALLYNVKDNLLYLGNESNPYVYLACSSDNYISVANIDSNCKIIGYSAFYNCALLKKVSFGLNSQLISIGMGAFSSCSLLTEIQIPNSVDFIGNGAFDSCKLLNSIVLPDGIKSISNDLLSNCISLNKIDLPNSITYVGDSAFSNCHSISLINLPNNVKGVGDFAFSNCSSLATVKLPNSLVPIGSGAFANCKSLSLIELPNSLVSIGSGAFDDCNALNYNIENNLKYLGNENNKYMYLVSALTTDAGEFIINNKCKFIGSKAFADCVLLNSIDLPNSIMEIGESAFSNCVALTSIVIPNSVTFIGSEAFANCVSLIDISIPNSVKLMGEFVFDSCDLIEYNEINGVKYLGSKDNPYLYLAKVGTNSSGVNIDENCRFIGSFAFANCSSILYINLPSSLVLISGNAFYNCTSLISITIPASVGYIDETAFTNCTSLKGIEISDDNDYYKSIDGNLYTKDGRVLIKYLTLGRKEQTSFKVPNFVDRIYHDAFRECDILRSVTIPPSMMYINDGAFYHCASLTSINIPDSVLYIGNSAFQYCTLLNSIYIPDSVIYVGYSAFKYCDNLVIYCEVESRPSGWSSSWISFGVTPVIWGAKR